MHDRELAQWCVERLLPLGGLHRNVTAGKEAPQPDGRLAKSFLEMVLVTGDGKVGVAQAVQLATTSAPNDAANLLGRGSRVLAATGSSQLLGLSSRVLAAESRLLGLSSGVAGAGPLVLGLSSWAAAAGSQVLGLSSWVSAAGP